MTETDMPTRSRGLARTAGFVLVNCWLVYHLAAIVAAPASVPPSSSLERSAWLLFQPYVQALYLNHGYHYFAPQPAESTLLSWFAERDDGTHISGRIPNFEIQPRLLYHRHFMLTEFYGFVPGTLEDTWNRSYARHICHKYHASRVSMSRIRHYLPSIEMVVQGATLTNPESYEEQPLGTFRCDEF